MENNALLLSRNPSKADETDYYADFVYKLPPASYLASILRDTVEPVADMIRNDMAFPDPLTALWDQNVLAAKELADKRSMLAEAKRELSRLEMRCSSRRGELRDLASSAELIAKQIRKTFPPTS